MNSVMLSIQPKWCNLILTGDKTLEVRKTKPAEVKLGKLDEPFRCYIYCTGVKKLPLAEYVEIHRATGGAIDGWHGKVIAEFMCDGIYPICYTMDGFADVVDCDRSCMKPSDFIAYGKGKTLYGWNITELKVYDDPFPITVCRKTPRTEHCGWGECDLCEYGYEDATSEYGWSCRNVLTRPPQSWYYIRGDK